MCGEYKKATLEMKYAAKPRMLIAGKSMVVPLVERRWKLTMGCG